MFKKQLSRLLETEMDRKDFLKYTGLAAVALTGVSAALGTIMKQQPQGSIGSKSTTPTGYGAMAYGGNPRPK